MSEPLSIIFAGTPDFSVPPLQALLNSEHKVIAVYTQPDRPAGRGKKIHQSPVKALAVDNNIPVYQPVTLKDSEQQEILRELNADIMIVVAYGLLLPVAVLEAPLLGCLNIHASLLPRWRGAAPIQRAIEAGDEKSGVTIMQMAEGLDTGDMLSKTECDISATDTAQSLHDRLSQLGSECLLTTLNELQAGSITPEPQDDALATYAHKLTKEEAQIDWQEAASHIARRVRAFNPWPVCFTLLDGKAFRIWQADALTTSADAEPGCIIQASADGIDVATANGILRILEIQPPGKRRMQVGDFLNARQDFAQGQIQFQSAS